MKLDEVAMPLQGSQTSFPHYLNVEDIVAIDIITFNKSNKIIYGQVRKKPLFNQNI